MSARKWNGLRRIISMDQRWWLVQTRRKEIASFVHCFRSNHSTARAQLRWFRSSLAFGGADDLVSADHEAINVALELGLNRD